MIPKPHSYGKKQSVLPAPGLFFPPTWQAEAGPRTSSQRRCLQIGFVWRAPLEAAAEPRAQAPRLLALHSLRSSAWDTQPQSQCFHLACSWSGQHQLPPENLPDSPRELCCGSHPMKDTFPSRSWLWGGGKSSVLPLSQYCVLTKAFLGAESPAGSLACADLSRHNRN